MAATDRPSEQPCPFLELPREIRDEIYHLCVPRNHRNNCIAIYQTSRLPPSTRFPIGVPYALAPYPEDKQDQNCLALLEVSKQIRAEFEVIPFHGVVPFIEQVELNPGSTKIGFRPATFLHRSFAEVKCLEIQILKSLSEADQVVKKLLPPKVEHLKLNFHPAFLEHSSSLTWAKAVDALLRRKLHNGPNRFHPQLYLERYLSILPDECLRLRRTACQFLLEPATYVTDGENEMNEYGRDIEGSDQVIPSVLERECPAQLKMVTISIPTVFVGATHLHPSNPMAAHFGTREVEKVWLTGGYGGAWFLRHVDAIFPFPIPPMERNTLDKDIRQSETVFDTINIEGTPILEYAMNCRKKHYDREDGRTTARVPAQS